MAVVISPAIREKLASKHSVSPSEVNQCFSNRNGRFLEDERENHKSDPPTYWFIAETDYGRKLKVAFVHRNGDNYIRTAYSPSQEELRIYNKYGIIK